MADKVRDRRERGWSWFHNEVLQTYGPQLGPYGIAVYMALLTFADSKDHTCYPSMQQLADMTNMSRRQVITSLKTLEKLSLVKKTMRHVTGKEYASNLYTLLTPSSESYAPPSESYAPPSEYGAPPSEYGAQGVVNTVHRGGEYGAHELDSLNQTHLNQTHITKSPSLRSGDTRAPEDGKTDAAKPQKRKPQATKTISPASYTPTETQCAYASAHDFDLSEMVPHFLAHHRAKGSRFVSWEDAFWTWLHNGLNFQPTKAQPRASPPRPPNVYRDGPTHDGIKQWLTQQATGEAICIPTRPKSLPR